METEALATAIATGDRRALARAITLVESARADHRALATELLARLGAPTGGGVTGSAAPGSKTASGTAAQDAAGQGAKTDDMTGSDAGPRNAATPDTAAPGTAVPSADRQDATTGPAEARTTSPPGRQALRIGLTGAPGVGKSSFIEALGLYLTGHGMTVAVLAVDPSSQRSGGSLLGDKTRMEGLSRDPRAFVRPTPSGAGTGGVARRSREVVTLCEAAGFDVILLETVGTGQSETMAAGMVDVLVLLIAPGGGDDLQGVKRGIMEHADLILVTKADGDLHAQARATRADYAAALRLLRPRKSDPPGFPRAITVSARDSTDIDKAWQAITTIADWRRDQGVMAATRAGQARAAFREEVTALLLARLMADPALAERMAALEGEVVSGRITPASAALQAVIPETGDGT